MPALTATTPTSLSPDAELRETLLSFYLNTLTGTELSDWLAQLGEDPRNSVEEKQRRIRASTKYLTMPAKDFPGQTEDYLKPYSANHLADLCEDLGVSDRGTKDELYRRIMREVHCREGWLKRPKGTGNGGVAGEDVAHVLGLFPILKRGSYEKDFYPVIWDELSEVFGEGSVCEQYAVAHGTTLKIDFHVGDPTGEGVGVEVKMPANNSDVQKALGQLDQYQRRYGSDLILFVLGDLLKPEALQFFLKELSGKHISTVVR